VDFGARRAHEQAAVAAARASVVGGFVGTSNLEAGLLYGIPTVGTSAHSFTLLHDTEEEAFAAQVASLGPSTTILVDTYDIATGVERVRPVLEIADLVLVMSVTPGFGGQSLIEATLERTRDLVRLRATEGYRYLIQMDGGINDRNVGRVALAGCDVVVAGSAVFQSPDPGAFLDAMRVKVKEALDDADIGS